jgi:hypothetical protein
MLRSANGSIRTHNAEVVSSSLTLATKIRHLYVSFLAAYQLEWFVPIMN